MQPPVVPLPLTTTEPLPISSIALPKAVNPSAPANEAVETIAIDIPASVRAVRRMLKRFTPLLQIIFCLLLPVMAVLVPATGTFCHRNHCKSMQDKKTVPDPIVFSGALDENFRYLSRRA
jgi:hypothetical protein